LLCLEELSITRSSTAAIGRTTDSGKEGALAGVVMAGVVAIEMCLRGGMQDRGIAATGNALVLPAVAWLIANVCVGVAEEFRYRLYALRTL
jgi:membrane protease YdiL (CAAX protease family)